MYQWLVIGISGVTCGGKTSLTFRLRDLLIQHFQSRKQTINVVTVSQDDYFLKCSDPRHILLPSLDHFNWDIPTAVDLNRMYEDALKIMSASSEVKGKQLAVTESSKQSLKTSRFLRGILLIEGFLILNHMPTLHLCHLRYYILLSRALCTARRTQRTYDPPDVPGYFEQCTWPEHVKHRSEILGKGKLVDESDFLSMEELKKCMEEERISSDAFIGKSESESVPSMSLGYTPQTASVDSEETETPHVGKDTPCNKDLYMRIGGNVFPLNKFGAAGLGMVDNIRVLNGGVLDKETLAQLVFKDILSELENQEMVNQEVSGINSEDMK